LLPFTNNNNLTDYKMTVKALKSLYGIKEVKEISEENRQGLKQVTGY